MQPKKIRRFNYERATFWLAVMTLVTGVIFGWLAYKGPVDVARDSGQLRKPSLKIGLGSLELVHSRETNVLFGAPTLDDSDASYVGAIPLTITNTGDATLDDAGVTFRFHKAMFRRDVLEKLDMKAAGSAQFTQTKRTFTQDETFHYSSYLLPPIHPKDAFAIGEPIFLTSTSLDFTAAFETADKERGTAAIHADFSLQFLVSVVARNTSAANYTVNLSTVQAKSMGELNQIAVKTHVTRHVEDVRRGASFGQYLRGLIFGIPEETLYLVFPEYDSRPVDEGRLYFARPDPKIRQLSYEPVTWRLLFGRRRAVNR